jgi:outer membrane murein-binding lipoprotein Lpp
MPTIAALFLAVLVLAGCSSAALAPSPALASARIQRTPTS